MRCHLLLLLREECLHSLALSPSTYVKNQVITLVTPVNNINHDIVSNFFVQHTKLLINEEKHSMHVERRQRNYNKIKKEKVGKIGHPCKSALFQNSYAIFALYDVISHRPKTK